MEAAGVSLGRENGMHGLRHFYVSVLPDAGESIKALLEYLGHHNPGFMRRMSTHLMPASRECARNTIDDLFGVSEGEG